MNTSNNYLEIRIRKYIAITEYKGPKGDIKNTVNVFGMLLPDGKTPVVVGVMMTKAANGTTIINKIRTIHAHGNAEISDNNILYLNEDKKRTRNWFQVCGNSVPLNGTQFGLIRSIAYEDGRSQPKKSSRDFKQAQLDVIQQSNPADIRYSERDNGKTDRELLAEAFEHTELSAKEKTLLEQYKQNIDKYNNIEKTLKAEQEKLRGMQKTDRFGEATKKQRDVVRRLQDKLTKADKALLSLEAAKPLKDVLYRERERVRREERRKVKERFDERTCKGL